MKGNEFDQYDTELVAITQEKEAQAQRILTQHLLLSDFQTDVADLKTFVESCGGKWYGLTLETLLHFSFRYIVDWINPHQRCKSEVNDYIPAPRSCMIIPADTSIPHGNYFAWEETNVTRTISHIGFIETLFNADALTSDAKIIPVVSNPVAAAAIWQATHGKFPAVSFNTNNAKETLLKVIQDKNPVDKNFLFLLDADQIGRITAGSLIYAFREIQMVATAKFLDDFLADEDKKNCADSKATNGAIRNCSNAFSILEAKGDEFLNDLIQRIADDAQKDFDRLEKEIAEEKAQAERVFLTSDQYFFLFGGETSDKEFAKRMIYLFGDSIRWQEDDLKWLTFDRNEFGGGLWKVKGESNSCLFPFARDLSDRLEANAKKDHDKKISKAFMGTKIFSSTISMMKSFGPTSGSNIIVTAADLDNHPNLLNCLNCVVDLQTGKQYEKIDASLLLTKQANAVYRGIDFRNEEVSNFLTSIQPNDETRAALLRYLGYCCVGRIREHVFQIWKGDGRNGKSTALTLLAETLGTYCVTLAKSAVLDTGKPDDPNAPTPSLSVLEGARLAIVPELAQTARLNSVLIKHLCAGDALPIRPLHCEQRTIKPVAKYILNGNFNPAVSNVNDFGLKERIRNMPFSQTFTGNDADLNLPERLATQDARSAFLAILVAEAGKWYSHGLLESEEMIVAKAQYFTANDFIAEFVAENCEYGKGFIELKDFIETLKDNSDETHGTPDRILKDMVKKQLDGKNGVKYEKSTDKKSRRYGFSGIHWIDDFSRGKSVDGPPPRR